ncbi:MAG TPA: ASCH domain-containing protein, partial [Myxococcota bacterium]|nr:ASCH domain-containing protein [Myxococcota bacterium]
FWRRALDAGAIAPGTPLPTAIESFGDSAALADELLALVIDGPKRATAAALADYQRSGDAVPMVGALTLMTDGAGIPRAILRTTEVRIGPLSSVDDRFAWDEGEGDRSRADWLRSHTAYFQRYLPTLGLAFDPDMEVVFERFELVYSE